MFDLVLFKECCRVGVITTIYCVAVFGFLAIVYGFGSIIFRRFKKILNDWSKKNE